MNSMFVMNLDEDLARHLAVALRMYRTSLKKSRYHEPPELEELETATRRAINTNQEASQGITFAGVTEDSLDDRDFLSRQDVHRLTGASLSTVDRWVATGRLPSRRQGRLRRITRTDLDRFLAAA